MNPERKKLFLRADKVWSRIVGYQFNQHCILCGRPGTDAHHWLYIRSILQYRWNLSNGVYTCRICHSDVDRLPELLLEKIAKDYPEIWTWSKDRPPLGLSRVSSIMITETLNMLELTASKLGIQI